MDITEVKTEVSKLASLMAYQAIYDFPDLGVKIDIPQEILRKYPYLPESVREIAKDRLTALLKLLDVLEPLQRSRTLDDTGDDFPSKRRDIQAITGQVEPTETISDDPGEQTEEQTETQGSEDRHMEILGLISEAMACGDWMSVRDIRQAKKKLRTAYTSEEVRYVLSQLLGKGKIDYKVSEDSTKYRLIPRANT